MAARRLRSIRGLVFLVLLGGGLIALHVAAAERGLLKRGDESSIQAAAGADPDLLLIAELRAQGKVSAAEVRARSVLGRAGLSAITRARSGIALGELMLEQGRPAEAIPVLEEAISDSTDRYDETRNWARVRLVQALIQAERPEDVAAVRNEIVADHDAGKANDLQLAWTLVGSGQALSTAGTLEEARRELKQAVVLAATTSDSYLVFCADMALVEGIVNAARRNSGPDDALAVADQLLEHLGPKEPAYKRAAAKVMRSHALAWNRRYHEAIQTLTEIVDEYGGLSDPRLEDACVDALLHAYAYSAVYLGDPASGDQFLAQVRSRYPDRRHQPLIRKFQALVKERSAETRAGTVSRVPR